jgi:RNA polymerase sigma factor (TIGR02999 family)
MNSVSANSPNEITNLLHKWTSGDQSALDQLIPLVYQELRRQARLCLRRERAGTMQTTTLVHEVYLRLVDAAGIQWHDRSHFFAISGQLMRRVLVDEARKRQAQKRGGTVVRLSFEQALVISPDRDQELLALDEALERLTLVAPRKSRVVELRFFGGLSIEETAAALKISTDTVKREWRTAKLWLLHELERSHA